MYSHAYIYIKIILKKFKKRKRVEKRTKRKCLLRIDSLA